MRTWADKGWMPCMTIVSRVTYMGSAMAARSSGWRHPLAGTGVSTCPFISLHRTPELSALQHFWAEAASSDSAQSSTWPVILLLQTDLQDSYMLRGRV